MNSMSNWEKRAWLVLFLGVSIGIAVYFGNAALEKLEAIRLIGKESLVKVENAGRIVEGAQSSVTRAADNSDKIVGHSEKVLEEITALKEWRDNFEQEIRTRADRFEWRLDHPIDAVFGRQPKKGGQR